VVSARVEELRKRLEKDPGSRLFAQLAEELRKEGQLVEAIRVCHAGLQKHPGYPSARMTLARCLFDSGDLLGARAELEGVVATAPDNILAHRLLAESCESLGVLPEAAQAFRAALRLSPGDKQLAAHLETVEARARQAAARPVAQPSIADMENRFAPAHEGGTTEPPPVALVEAEEEFVVERSGEALAAATLPPRSRPAASVPTPAPAAAVSAPADELVFEFDSVGEPAAAAAPFEPVFRPLDDVAPPSNARSRPARETEEEVDATLAPGGVADAGVVPAHPAPFESALPATVPGVALADVAGSALASPTLAEIYFGQGAYDQAIETYEEVLRREPANDAARARLAEIGALVAEQALAAEAGGAEGRRAVLLRTIARLEALLVAVGGSDPCPTSTRSCGGSRAASRARGCSSSWTPTASRWRAGTRAPTRCSRPSRPSTPRCSGPAWRRLRTPAWAGCAR